MEKAGSEYEEAYLLWAAWRHSDYWPSHIMRELFKMDPNPKALQFFYNEQFL